MAEDLRNIERAAVLASVARGVLELRRNIPK
jgi:hypothetical protein